METNVILQKAPITQLHIAARLAGLRFRSGTLTREQIIEILEKNPQILRAAVAILAKGV
jgi:hypothetical protein